MAGSVWLNTQSQYHGINDTPTEKVYQINNGLDDTLHNMRRIQREELEMVLEKDSMTKAKNICFGA